ncbi:hypothetical protein SCLCIDRAFT_59887, partial [Scleroderma citrinum Foug A]
KRARKSIFSETQSVVDEYYKALDELTQEFRDRAVRDTSISVHHVIDDLDDLSLDGMAYAEGAGLDTTKKFLDGTRVEILREIVDWINDSDVNAPRIFWLHGQAGRGKSAIAHTIALQYQNAGGICSCFCFARDRQTERREQKILSTIARDLADRDPTFRRALVRAIKEDNTLTATHDVMEQWEKLLKPLSEVTGERVGNIVVVIDALDESGLSESRRPILEVLTEAASLPSNFRILLTSRPLADIVVTFRDAQHVKVVSLDKVSAEPDIHRYVSRQLMDVRGIGVAEINQIVRRADGLFEWARLACEWIRPGIAGEVVKERFDDLMAHTSREGVTLLDKMYLATLESALGRRQRPLARFRSLMRQILYTLEPLPLYALQAMRMCFPHKEDHFNITLILDHMGSLLSGITDHRSPIRLLHSSLHDFLTDYSRSGDYFVGESGIQAELAFASLCVLHGGLCFNICGLENSYLLNSDVPGLAERIKANIPSHLSYSCLFWSKHLQETRFDPELAGFVKDILGSERILFWFEVLSLLGVLGNAASALFITARWFQVSRSDAAVLAMDGVKFIHNFASGASASTPHLYMSALPFAPENAMPYRNLRAIFPCIAKVVEGYDRDWPAAQVLFRGHTSFVTSVAFSPDGTRIVIVSGSLDKTVRVWDADRGVQIGSPLHGHTSLVTSVAFSPDGTRIVSGSSDKILRVWDADRGVQIGSPLQGHTSSVTSVAFSPDGTRIVSGSLDKNLRVWGVDGGVHIDSPLQGHTFSVTSVAFSPDGTRIVSGSHDKTVRVWDADRGVQIGSPIQGHTSSVRSVSFSPDGTRIVSGSFDKTVRVWDADRGVHIGSPLQGHISSITSVAFSPDGTRIISSPLHGHTSSVTSVTFSPDGTRIVSGSGDTTVRMWDADMDVQIGNPFQGHTSSVTSVAFSPDGTRIVSGSHDNS